MKRNVKLIIIICTFLTMITGSLRAELWGDTVESKIDVIDGVVVSNDSILDIIDSKLDVIDQEISVIDAAVTSGTIYLTSADVVSGNITLSSGGHYTLAETLTTDITISGDCITLDLNDLCLTGSITISPSVSNDDITVQNGTVLMPGDYSTYAINLSNMSTRIRLAYLTIFASTSATGDGPGGIGVYAAHSIIENCMIITGNGGSNAFAGGGNGIVMDNSDHVTIKNCLISTGNGGGDGTDGGDGGIGIFILVSSNIEVADCTIFKTGSGGNGVTTAGSGGDGISIVSSCSDVAVHNCIIRNTGAVGTGGASPVAGKAINDDVASGISESQIYSNFAHNIANATKYDLQASGLESGFALSNPPSSTAVSVYANVFIS